MNYAEMSDFEINHLVAKVSGVNIKCIMLDSDDNHSGVIIGRKNTRERREFNPCNSWADAGPIIEDNSITIIADDFYGWTAFSSLYLKEGSTYIDVFLADHLKSYNENPRRAAMIVFLMMKDYGK